MLSTRSRWFGAQLETLDRIELIFLVGVLQWHEFLEAIVQAWLKLWVLAAIFLLRQWTEQYILIIIDLRVIVWLKRELLCFQVILRLDHLGAVLGVRDDRWSIHFLASFDVRVVFKLLEIDFTQLI